MNESISQTIFSTFPFLRQLDSQLKIDFLNQVQQVNLAEGKFICLEGDLCNHLPLVLCGSLRVYKIGESGREITLYHLEKGDSCIMTASCIMSERVFPAFAITETEVKAIIIPAKQLRQWVNHNPIWQNYIFGLLSQRLANVIEIVEEVAFRRMDRRIASYLLKIAGHKTQTMKITHARIAEELGTSREVVSRILKNFEKKGLLYLSRGIIKLQNCDGLEDILKVEKL